MGQPGNRFKQPVIETFSGIWCSVVRTKNKHCDHTQYPETDALTSCFVKSGHNLPTGHLVHLINYKHRLHNGSKSPDGLLGTLTLGITSYLNLFDAFIPSAQLSHDTPLHCSAHCN